MLEHAHTILVLEYGILDHFVASDHVLTELISLGEWFGHTCDQLDAAIAYRNSRLARSQNVGAQGTRDGLTFSEAAVEFQKAMFDVEKRMTITQAKNAIANARRRIKPPFKSKGKRKSVLIEAVSFFRWVRAKKDAHLDSLH